MTLVEFKEKVKRLERCCCFIRIRSNERSIGCFDGSKQRTYVHLLTEVFEYLS